MKNNRLQDMPTRELSAKLQTSKTAFKAIAILHGILMLVMFAYYMYQGSQRGFDDVKGLKSSFLSIAGFQLFMLLLPFINVKNIEKELHSRHDL